MMNYAHAQAAGIFQIHGAVINEDAFFRRFLGYFQGHTKNGFFRFSRMDVAGTEKDLKVATKTELGDAVVVQFQRFVVNSCDKVLAGARGFRKDSASFRIFPGLRQHERDELCTAEGMRAVEESAIEILVESDLPRVEGGESEIVTVLEILPIELESFRSAPARFVLSTIGEDHAANIPKKRGNARQSYLHRDTEE
jgi:hypothetical protein